MYVERWTGGTAIQSPLQPAQQADDDNRNKQDKDDTEQGKITQDTQVPEGKCSYQQILTYRFKEF